MSKTEELTYYFKEPQTYGWIEVHLSDYLINHIWSCVDDAHGNLKPELVGHIEKSLAIKDKKNILFDQLLKPLVIAYGNKWNHNHCKLPIYQYTNNATGQDAIPYTYNLEQFWVNYQNQHEFNPIHNHGGVYSFAAWLKIPTDHHQQQQVYNAKDSSGGFNSSFCFHYTDSLGNIRTSIYEQSPRMEGTLLLFPSALNHEVYPYYECGEQRVSISGNIWLRPKK
tara:strand:- start:44 stop:715 length:672 start_codon:yes stop_codon:yes gene_type:complete